jgi:formylglycine-generating enzyme required for sulfatase activity
LVACLSLVQERYPARPAGEPEPRAVEGAEAQSAAEMHPYRELLPGTAVGFELVPLAGGTFRMGSPAGEAGRKASEGPAHDVTLGPFWIGKCEVTWDEYLVFMMKLDQELRAAGAAEAVPQDAWADAVSRPTPPYVPMDFGMGVEGFPAVGMTQFAARQYTQWLSMKTGRFYRLPSEAEWEYACRAGTASAYSCGDDPKELEAHAWSFASSGERYHKVGEKLPNPFGLHDMHGNVAEWVLDRYDDEVYRARSRREQVVDPVEWPTALYPHVVRGGSWDDEPDRLRSAARRGSSPQWQVQDPQLPKSIWYHTDAPFVGFRVVRPLVAPPPEERARYWDPDTAELKRILERQRRGER